MLGLNFDAQPPADVCAVSLLVLGEATFQDNLMGDRAAWSFDRYKHLWLPPQAFAGARFPG